MAFEVEFQDKNLKAMLTDLSRKMDDIKHRRQGIIGLMSAIVYKDIIEHFSKEEGSSGEWKEWSQLYGEAQARRGRAGNKILQDSGRLRQTFKPTTYRVSNEGVTWYNNAKTKDGAPYAYYHDEGVGQPKRDFMWLSNKALSKLESEVLQYLMEDKP